MKKYIVRKQFLGLLFLVMFSGLSAQTWIENLLFNSTTNVVRMDFSTVPPVTYTTNTTAGGSPATGLAHAEDGGGGFLFYVNSFGVYDQNYDLMPGSSGILADPSSAEFNICPFPYDSTKYYILYNEETASPLSYSIVDLTLRGGLGDVVSLNTSLDASSFTEGMEIVRVPCSENCWFIAYDINAGIKGFLIDSNGINPATTIYSHTPPTGYDGRGELDYHDGKLGIAFAYADFDQVLVVDFEPFTGIASNPDRKSVV